MENSSIGSSGLNQKQVEESRILHGKNIIDKKKENAILLSLRNAAKDPMLLLLVAASVIYFLNGSMAEAIFMVTAIIVVSSISIYQELMDHAPITFSAFRIRA